MRPAKPIVVDIMQRLNPRLVLDLGCGRCKFSRRFLDEGASVVGVDKKSTIESFENFKFVLQDVLDFKFEPKYDLIIGTGILHHLIRKDAFLLIERMKKNTLTGGYHFLICMSNEEKSSDSYFYPDKEMLNKLYFGWDIIYNESCLSKKHGEPRHQHKMIIFLARKT